MESSSVMLTYRSPILVTFCYFCLYYLFMIYQMNVKFAVFEKEKIKATTSPSRVPTYNEVRYSSQDTSLLAADRTVGNCLEQMIPFLTSLWLYSIFVSPERGGTVGMIYVLTRSYYPIVFKMGGGWLLLSTIPNYCCIWYMLYQLAGSVL